MIKPTISYMSGSDPEGFLQRGREIIGSEKHIPKDGFNFSHWGSITRDGVQFELHPRESYDKRALINNTAHLLGQLFKSTKNVGLEICFDGLVEVSKHELESLSPENQVLGCTPSVNVYEDKPIEVDAKQYRKRSAGGHLHIGALANREFARKAIPLFDIFVGNTCVLLDRDPGAAERRQTYGRAGECRFPKYGLEYRTISNFWLRTPELMQFVFDLTSIPVNLFVHTTTYADKSAWNDLVAAVDIEAVKLAIDTNDYGMAKENLQMLIPYMVTHLDGFSFNPRMLDKFFVLADTINTRGIDYVYPKEEIWDRWACITTEPSRDIRLF